MNLTEVITKARSGDKEAITTLYDAYKTPVYYLCRKLTQDDNAAAETMQRSFLHAYHKLNLLRDPEDFPKWIMAVASNRCKNFVKDRYADVFDADLPESEQNCDFTIPEFAQLSAVAASDEARGVISAAIDKMPIRERFALMMCFFGAMTEIQASRILECSEAETRVLLQCAVSALENTAATRGAQIAELADFRPEEINAVLMRDAEFARVPGYVAEEISKSAPAMIAGAKQQKEAQTTEYRRTSRRGTVLVPILIAILGIAVIAGGFFVGSRIRQNTTEPDDTSAPITTPGDSTSSAVPDDTTEPDNSTTADPGTTPAPDDTTNEPPVTDPIVTDPPVTEPPVTDPGTPTDVSSFTCKTVGGKVTVTAFTGKETHVIIPSAVNGKPVTAIGDKAFLGTKVQSVTIPDSVTVIGINAFKDCTELTEVNIPSSVTEIRAYAFRGCTKLAKISVPDSVRTIGPTCFGDTAWFASQTGDFFTIGKGILVKYRGNGGDVTVPSGVISLSNAFYYDGRSTSVTLPDTVTSIGQFAFCGCSKLTSITIPASVTSMDPQAIYNCKTLKTIVVKKGSYADTWCAKYGFSSLVKYN